MSRVIPIICAFTLAGFTASHIVNIERPINEKYDDLEVYVCPEYSDEHKDCVWMPGGKIKFDRLDIKYNPPLGIGTANNQREINCLAKNIREEASATNYMDMVSVAWATINRVKDPRFPNTICSVVYSGQMSWTRDNKKRNRGFLGEHLNVAKKVLLGAIDNPFPDCPVVGWYNLKLDRANTFNERQMKKTASCVGKLVNSVHIFVAYP